MFSSALARSAPEGHRDIPTEAANNSQKHTNIVNVQPPAAVDVKEWMQYGVSRRSPQQVMSSDKFLARPAPGLARASPILTATLPSPVPPTLYSSDASHNVSLDHSSFHLNQSSITAATNTRLLTPASVSGPPLAPEDLHSSTRKPIVRGTHSEDIKSAPARRAPTPKTYQQLHATIFPPAERTILTGKPAIDETLARATEFVKKAFSEPTALSKAMGPLSTATNGQKAVERVYTVPVPEMQQEAAVPKIETQSSFASTASKPAAIHSHYLPPRAPATFVTDSVLAAARASAEAEARVREQLASPAVAPTPAPGPQPYRPPEYVQPRPMSVGTFSSSRPSPVSIAAFPTVDKPTPKILDRLSHMNGPTQAFQQHVPPVGLPLAFRSGVGTTMHRDASVKPIPLRPTGTSPRSSAVASNAELDRLRLWRASAKRMRDLDESSDFARMGCEEEKSNAETASVDTTFESIRRHRQDPADLRKLIHPKQAAPARPPAAPVVHMAQSVQATKRPDSPMRSTAAQMRRVAEVLAPVISSQNVDEGHPPKREPLKPEKAVATRGTSLKGSASIDQRPQKVPDRRSVTFAEQSESQRSSFSSASAPDRAWVMDVLREDTNPFESTQPPVDDAVFNWFQPLPSANVRGGKATATQPSSSLGASQSIISDAEVTAGLEALDNGVSSPSLLFSSRVIT